MCKRTAQFFWKMASVELGTQIVRGSLRVARVFRHSRALWLSDCDCDTNCVSIFSCMFGAVVSLVSILLLNVLDAGLQLKE